MPAPKALSGLPKPLLFGLYGAVGGLLGALVFGELAWWLLKPPEARAGQALPQVAVAAAKEVEVFVGDQNAFPVKVARADFDGPVTVRLEGLPAGVTAEPVVIPTGKVEGEMRVVASPRAAVGTAAAKLLAEATAEGKTASADTNVSFKVWNPPKPKADIVFVLDVTVSMQWAIDELKNGAGKFADALGKARIDFRLGLVTFRDVTQPGEGVDVVQFDGSPFTADGAAFRDKAGRLVPSGGGPDIPESSFEAVEAAAKMPFRDGATRVLLLITDAPPKASRTNAAAAVKAIQASKIDSVHVVALKLDADAYKPLLSAGLGQASGRHFDLGDVVRGEEGFDPILAGFGEAVTVAARATADATLTVPSKSAAPDPGVKSLQSGEQAAGSKEEAMLQSGVWTAAVAGLVCLALLAGQHHYLRGTLPRIGGVLVGLVGGAVVGFVGGAAGQWLYTLAPGSAALGMAFQVLGWALLGGLAGAGLSLFIPNLKWTLGLAGGAIGGAVGAAGFLAVLDSAGDTVGRLVGGLLLGLCIGLMVALVEAAFRRAWLEVRYGARETITVNLGPEPVKIGGDAKACTVWARGAAPVALRFFVRDGKVVCDDAVMKRETPAADGFSREVGNVTITVRTGVNSAPAQPASRTAPPPAGRVSSAGVVERGSTNQAGARQDSAARTPSRVVDDEYDMLPTTVSPPPARVPPPPPPPPTRLSPEEDTIPVPPPKPAPVAAKPPVPAPPKPVAAPSKPPAPAPPKPPTAAPPKPAAPAPPAGPKNPDGCPSCGRVNAGKPKQRYCMVCDTTY